MTDELIMKLGQDALKTTALLSAPLLGAALVTGLVVSVFQAITQINEATLTFIPKMIVIALVLLRILFGFVLVRFGGFVGSI